jgi:hypothetical protein
MGGRFSCGQGIRPSSQRLIQRINGCRTALCVTLRHPVMHNAGRELEGKLGLFPKCRPQLGTGRTCAGIALAKSRRPLDCRTRGPTQAGLLALINRHEEDNETEPKGSTNEKHDATPMLVVNYFFTLAISTISEELVASRSLGRHKAVGGLIGAFVVAKPSSRFCRPKCHAGHARLTHPLRLQTDSLSGGLG